MNRASAYANANIALIKYWGKSDDLLNIPAVSSISMTLSSLGTQVTIAARQDGHCLFIDGQSGDGIATSRLVKYLETVRGFYPYAGFLAIHSQSHVPYMAGLASSASFYAALAYALSDFFELNLKEPDLSRLARLGSASAARSIYGGMVGLHGGLGLSHNQAHAYPISMHRDLHPIMVVAMVKKEQKRISSRDAMSACRNTSPFFAAFIEAQYKDLRRASEAIAAGDLSALGTAMERSTLKMFATMWTAEPAIMYWQPETLKLIDLIYRLRAEHGPIAYFTMDAGPNVKILCQKESLSKISAAILADMPNIELLVESPGPGVRRSTCHLM